MPSPGGGVSLGGVNGSANVHATAGPVDVRFEVLEKGLKNVVSTGKGDVTVTVVRMIAIGTLRKGSGGLEVGLKI